MNWKQNIKDIGIFIAVILFTVGVVFGVGWTWWGISLVMGWIVWRVIR